MDIKVREVSAEEKSSQEIEQELLDKHEEKQQSETGQDNVEVVEEPSTEETTGEEKAEQQTSPEVEETPEVKELDENEVLSYIGKRYGKEINSIDELVSKREESEPLPEDVAAYLKYKKETGRGFNDFAKLQKDYSDLSPVSFLYLR
jgi:preprotein translocase subunit SecD